MKELFLKNIYKPTIYTLLLALLFFSCVEDIDLELNDQKNSRFVVEGRLTDQLDYHTIKITKTISYSINEPVPTIDDAEVFLLEEGSGNTFPLISIDSMPGYYSTERIKGNAFENYKLTIKADGETFEASSFLDTVPQMDSIGYEYVLEEYFGYQYGYYTVKMSAYEPAPIGHIYMFKVYMNDVIMNPWLDDTPYQDDELMNENYMANVEIYYFEQEYITKDTNELRVEMYSISRDEWRFNNAFITEASFGGSMFAGPPANIPTNIINTGDGLDGIGFFGTSSVSTLVMPFIKEHADSTNREDFSPRPR